MDTVVKKLYEGLFLVDSSLAAADWAGVTASIERAFSRADADVVEMKKWDERRLAYDVKGKSRGTYILAYFNCDPLKITSIERDIRLSESVIRLLILRTDKMSKEDMEKEVPFVLAERRAAEEAAAAQEAAEARQEVVDARNEAARANEAEEELQEDDVAEEVPDKDDAAEEI